MGILYQNIGKSIALRANQLGDAVDAATLLSNYALALSANMTGVEVPHLSLREDILNVEAELAAMIGNSSNVQLRTALLSDSETLEMASDEGMDIPVSGENGKFLGKFDGLYNAVTHLPLQMMEKHVVLRRMRNAGDFFRLKHGCYFIEGSKVFFTCSTQSSACKCVSTPTATCPDCGRVEAYFRGCSWSRNRAEVAFDLATGLGTSVMPQQVALLWQNMVLANLAQENFFIQEAGFFGSKAAECAQNIGLVMEASGDALTTNTENQNARSENG